MSNIQCFLWLATVQQSKTHAHYLKSILLNQKRNLTNGLYEACLILVTTA